MKIEKRPATILYPIPVVLVTSIDQAGKPNIITIAWAGVVCSQPPMVGIAIRPSRYSHELITRSRELVVNMPTAEHLKMVDYCGMVSGREVDKFKETGFTPLPASRVKPPLIKECPVNMECEVRHILQLGAHDLFVAEIVVNHVDEEVLDEKGRVNPQLANPLAYNGAQKYWTIAREVGTYGLSKGS
ncbi:MAG: flavin reductase family protein [Syntrophomonadales bacterium]